MSDLALHVRAGSAPFATGTRCRHNRYCNRAFDGGFASIADLTFHKGNLPGGEVTRMGKR